MSDNRPRAPIPDDERTVVFRPQRRAAGGGLAPGSILGSTYRIEALLARGGMGEVYRATHVELGTTHAIKVILPALANDQKMVRMLVEEARKLSRLRHDAIVAYEGLFRDERGLRYLVMEFVEGASLAALIAQRRLEPAEVLQLRDRLASGLAAAHEQGIIHRDLSPENIILPRGDVGRAKIIDFGIAKAADAEATVVGANNFAGKQAYASPEQLGLFGGQVDLRCDIYSLGLVLANAAIGFGKTLDLGTTLTQVLAKRSQPADLGPLPAELRPVIAPMLAPRPEDRPPSMRALTPQAAAPAGATATGIVAAPPAAPARGGVRLAQLLPVLAALVIVVAAGAGLYFFRTAIWPPSIETVRAEVAATTAGFDCAKLTPVINGDRSVRITGHAASSADIERLQRAINGIAGIGKVSFDVHELVWPYCQVVRLLQPYSGAAPRELPTLALAGTPAYSGERLALSIAMPNYDGYLYVDYFVRQGQVLHLLPNGNDRLNIKPAHNRFVLGGPRTRTCWTLGDVTGEQLVTAVASSRPLFAGPLPDIEGAQTYLDALAQALSSARQAGAATLFFDLQQTRLPNPAAACPHA